MKCWYQRSDTNKKTNILWERVGLPGNNREHNRMIFGDFEGFWERLGTTRVGPEGLEPPTKAL